MHFVIVRSLAQLNCQWFSPFAALSFSSIWNRTRFVCFAFGLVVWYFCSWLYIRAMILSIDWITHGFLGKIIHFIWVIYSVCSNKRGEECETDWKIGQCKNEWSNSICRESCGKTKFSSRLNANICSSDERMKSMQCNEWKFKKKETCCEQIYWLIWLTLPYLVNEMQSDQVTMCARPLGTASCQINEKNAIADRNRVVLLGIRGRDRKIK